MMVSLLKLATNLTASESVSSQRCDTRENLTPANELSARKKGISIESHQARREIGFTLGSPIPELDIERPALRQELISRHKFCLIKLSKKQV
jgi:hypothetical protein